MFSSKIKATYLDSIHEDIRFVLEGINLFIKRDYPYLWSKIEKGQKVSREEIKNYIKETESFRDILDTHLQEFITYLYTSKTDKKNLDPKEKEIFQMLSYAYLTTGNFITSRSLEKKGDFMRSKEFTINTASLNGNEESFELTRKLKIRKKLIFGRLTSLNLKFRYFSDDDMDIINSNLKIVTKPVIDPISAMYINTYEGIISEYTANKNHKIPLNTILSYIKFLKYNDISSEENKQSSSFRERVLSFPVIKGRYEVKTGKKNIKIQKIKQRSFILTKKSKFLGLEQTGFRTSDSKTAKVYLISGSHKIMPDQYCEYNTTYQLFMGNKKIGYINPVPCYQNTCFDEKNITHGITPVKVYSSKLILYKDMIDQIKNNSKYAPDLFNKELPLENRLKKLSPVTEKKKRDKDNAAYDKKEDAEKIHLFSGCAADKESVF